MEKPRVLIITGMSGAGKTQVVCSLEDLDYFCVDNLPPTLIPKFTELCQREGSTNKLALVVDVRGGRFFNELVGVLDQLESESINYELLFLDASDTTLIRRYKETRRPHPLDSKEGLSHDISEERKILSSVRNKATTVLDTTSLNTAGLREKIIELYGNGNKEPRMLVMVQSFGFKYGLPLDSDMILDVRFLPNPFYVPELKALCGNDKEVIDYISAQPITQEFVSRLENMLIFLLPQYVKEGKSQLMIGVGCTGGRHRSVHIANLLGEIVGKHGYKVRVAHRDLVK